MKKPDFDYSSFQVLYYLRLGDDTHFREFPDWDSLSRFIDFWNENFPDNTFIWHYYEVHVFNPLNS